MRLHYETDRLYLKILQPDAAPHVLGFYLDNREVFEQYEPARPRHFYTERYQYSLLQGEYNAAIRLSSIRFWVFCKSDPGQIIGTISFHNVQRSIFQCCQVGYKFDQRFWHQGYASEALLQGVKIMFYELKLHRIEAYVMPDNTPSLHLLESLGFEREGLVRDYAQIRGIWEPHYLYALLNG